MSKQKRRRSGKGKIQKTNISDQKRSRRGIQPTELTPPQGISFSFKYLDTNNRKFSGAGEDRNYWMTLLERLRDLSSCTAGELRQARNKTLRCHSIDWNDKRVSENRFGIPGEEQLVDVPYQFSLSSNQHGRVHGFFIEDVFFVVWLDPEHQLYPGT